VINVPSIAGEVDADNEVADDYQMDEMRRQIYVALTRGIETVIAWCPQGESERPWIQLVDHVLASDAEAYKREWAKADEEAAGPPLAFPRVTTVAPFKAEDPDEQLVRRTLALPSYRPAPVVRAAWRRWSYSQLGIADLVAGAVDADDILMAFDGGSGAEDHEFQGENFLDPGFKAFGELRGDNFGDAVHLTFQALLDGSDVTPANVRRQWELVSRRKGVPDGENRVAPALERLLVHPLGGPLTSRTLTDFVGGPSVHHASEMRFTLPLEAGRGVDRLGVVAALARDLDPDGPFAPFFAELTNAPAEQSRLAQGFLTGSLDLVLDVSTSEQPRFVIVDYKTNGLRTQRSYRPADLAVEMARSGYPMQALLYAVALYRYLSGRLGVDVASAAVGPVLYFYLRGALTATSPDDGLMWWDIPQDLIQAISHEFAEGVSA
jgi:exodeoxyribonuclease V beta subunit